MGRRRRARFLSPPPREARSSMCWWLASPPLYSPLHLREGDARHRHHSAALGEVAVVGELRGVVGGGGLSFGCGGGWGVGGGRAGGVGAGGPPAGGVGRPAPVLPPPRAPFLH